ncbi:uncharacterized protein B0H18DRAFT_1019804 [Fomitopsis serialis]|uniref:uncharacterized protein n=1 Tax=Fomitopsis serialis TaxID=139415 RepID=UPI002007479F|nr:uncharacterized protein B0H18DRAFT_1019804 [Neoantrodia serialis]KAH9921912.1 hypothetical protein B0H18DRAFT_1019804 [Neoantrodia serialis]
MRRDAVREVTLLDRTNVMRDLTGTCTSTLSAQKIAAPVNDIATYTVVDDSSGLSCKSWAHQTRFSRGSTPTPLRERPCVGKYHWAHKGSASCSRVRRISAQYCPKSCPKSCPTSATSCGAALL